MHIVDGEHGHAHSHHTHEHTHSHDHGHEHCGNCGGCGQKERPANEQEAILAYMLDHNRHHMAELLEIAKQFHAAGKDEAGVQLEKAAENFEKGNLYLSVALSLVKETSRR